MPKTINVTFNPRVLPEWAQDDLAVVEAAREDMGFRASVFNANTPQAKTFLFEEARRRRDYKELKGGPKMYKCEFAINVFRGQAAPMHEDYELIPTIENQKIDVAMCPEPDFDSVTDTVTAYEAASEHPFSVRITTHALWGNAHLDGQSYTVQAKAV